MGRTKEKNGRRCSYQSLWLEGIYAKMTELGLPLSLTVELQCGFRLNSSLWPWTARPSNGGYSISLCWSLQHWQCPGTIGNERSQRPAPN